jgi:hypothetical protein
MISAGDWLTSAVHEAGHVACYCSLRWPILDARIYEQSGEVLGEVRARVDEHSYVGRAAISLAGPLAEERHSGVDFSELARAGSRFDVAIARDVLSRRPGLPEFEQLLPWVRSMVANDWPFIQLVSAALLQHRQLDHNEVLQLIR